jgi:hypothetical protein
MKNLFYIEKRDESGWDNGNGSYIQFQGKRRMIQGKLKIDTEKVGDGNFWMMQRGLFIKAHYTEEDMFKARMYNEAEVLEDGEVVEITRIKDTGAKFELVSKKKYKFIAVGDYSDCGKFEEIAG